MNYKVSEQTAGLIKAYDATSQIYSCVYESLCKDYSEDDALAMIDEKLMPGLNAIADSILGLVSLSIKQRLKYVGKDEI